jgi:hypothetical protein
MVMLSMQPDDLKHGACEFPGCCQCFALLSVLGVTGKSFENASRVRRSRDNANVCWVAEH